MSTTLDCARVLAALSVFYYHIGLYLHLPLSTEGEYAVTAFLLLAVLSAVAFSLPKQGAGLRPASYLGTRLARLLPLYLFVNVFIYAISFAVPSQLGRPFTVVEFLLSCLGLSQYFGYRMLSLVFWFVPFIIQVYVLIAFGHRLMERLRGWWWTLVAFALFWLEIQGVRAWSGDPVTVLRDWSPVFRPAEMLLGVQGGLWFTGRLSDGAFAGRVGLYAALSGLLASGAYHDEQFAYIYTLPLVGLLVTLVIVGAAALCALGIPAGSVRLWRLLGRATYPFYLIHGLMIATIFHRFGSSPAVWVGYAVFCVLAAVTLDAIFAVRRRQSAPASIGVHP